MHASMDTVDAALGGYLLRRLSDKRRVRWTAKGSEDAHEA